MKVKPFIYIVLAGILWGTSGIFVGYLSPYGFAASELSLIRATVSFIGMALYVSILDKSLFKITPKELLFTVAIGAALFGTATSYYGSMQLTSVSTAVILMYTAPIYVTSFSIAFLQERKSKLKITSIALMLIGCALVSGIIGGLKFNTIGIILGILSGIIYASYNVVTKIALRRGLNAVTLALYGFLFMTVIAVFSASPARIFENASKNPSVTIPLMVGLGICTFIVPYFLYTLSMRDLPAGTASALSIIEPLAATLFSVIIFKEKLSTTAILGTVLILAATVLLARDELYAEKSKSCEKDKKQEEKIENHIQA